MSIQAIPQRDEKGRWKSMGGSNGSAGDHETSARVPRPAGEKPSRDITKSVIPFMSAIMLCLGVAGAGYAVGTYKSSTESRLQVIDTKLDALSSDVRAIKDSLQRKRTSRS